MNVYRIEVGMAATLYVKAMSEKGAIGIVKDLNGATMRFETGEIEVSEARFDDEALPEVSASPFATIVVGDEVTVDECVAEEV